MTSIIAIIIASLAAIMAYINNNRTIEANQKIKLLESDLNKQHLKFSRHFEVEFEIYRDTWKKLTQVKYDFTSLTLFYDDTGIPAKEKMETAMKSFDKFFRTYDENIPFFQDNIRLKFQKINAIFRNERYEIEFFTDQRKAMIKEIPDFSKKYWDARKDKKDEFMQLINGVREDIRQWLDVPESNQSDE